MSPSESIRASREQFVKRALVAGGAVAAGGAILGALPRPASSAPSPAQDVRILNLVLLLEYVESAFYAGARERGALRGELRDYVNVVGATRATAPRSRQGRPREQGAKATPPHVRERDHRPGRVRRRCDRRSRTLSVAAYNGQATNLTKPTLAVAAKIVSVEARHAAWIRAIAGKPPAADATDPSLTQAQVLATLQKTGFIRA